MASYTQSTETTQTTKFTLSSLSTVESTDVERSTSEYSIFIGCLPKRILKNSLIRHFSQYGEVVRLNIERKKSSDNSSTLINAYLECSSQRMMDDILSNPQIIEGNNIKVAKYMTEEELNSYVEKSRRCRIYIKRLPMDFDNEKLHNLFARYGTINKAYCVSGTKARKNLKYGYVLFKDEESIDNLPVEGIPVRNIKLQWTCYKHKVQKRKEEAKKQMYLRTNHQLNLHKSDQYPIFFPRQSTNFTNAIYSQRKCQRATSYPYPHSQRPYFVDQYHYQYQQDWLNQMECQTLYSQDQEFYNYLNEVRMFENSEYHCLKPSQINYTISVSTHMNHSEENIRMNTIKTRPNLRKRTIRMNNQNRFKKEFRNFAPYMRNY